MNGRKSIMIMVMCLTIVMMGCDRFSGGQGQAVDTSQVKTEQNDSVSIEIDEILFKTRNSHGDELVFLLKHDSISCSKVLYCNNKPIMFVNDGFSSELSEPWDESDIYEMAFFRSPDDKHLFVALKPSIAGSCDIFYKIHIYRIDIESLDVQWITNCGAVKILGERFETAEQVDRLNPESSCAEARFTARHVYYDYNGKKVGESKVMNEESVWNSFKAKSHVENIQCLELTEDKHNIYPLYLD